MAKDTGAGSEQRLQVERQLPSARRHARRTGVLAAGTSVGGHDVCPLGHATVGGAAGRLLRRELRVGQRLRGRR